MVGNLGSLKDSLGTFDVVTLWATIEHLPDPRRMILDIVSVLKPGGLLVLDTGIGADWLDKLLPGRTQWYTPPEHLFVFSRAGLELLLRDCGLKIERVDSNWERSSVRRSAKTVRNLVFAMGSRLVFAATGVASPSICYTRFPVGNLISVVARKRNG